MNDDLISRQAVIDFIKDHSYPVRYDETSIEQGIPLTEIEQALNEIPTVIKALNYDRDQYEKGYQDGKMNAQKTGQWIDTREQHGEFEFMCSNCELLCCTNHYNYCPHCGAKMEVDCNA